MRVTATLDGVVQIILNCSTMNTVMSSGTVNWPTIITLQSKRLKELSLFTLTKTMHNTQ